MLTDKRIAPHETFELHEILTFKNVCATKTSAMVGFVHDEELRTLFEHDFVTTQEHIKELQDLMQSSLLLENSDRSTH